MPHTILLYIISLSLAKRLRKHVVIIFDEKVLADTVSLKCHCFIQVYEVQQNLETFSRPSSLNFNLQFK